MQLKEILSTKFQLQPKFQIKMLLFNMSGDIVTQTFASSHKMVI